MDDPAWTQDGVTPHPTGGYVRVEKWSYAVKYLDASGLEHRLDGPAFEYADGTRTWCVDGYTHRLEGPAIEYADGTREWCVDGRRHRLFGPARVWADGTREWWAHGRRHHFYGPARVWADGTREWWLHDVQVTEAEHAEIVARWRETGEAPHT